MSRPPNSHPAMPESSTWEWIQSYLDAEHFQAVASLRSRVESLTKAPFHLHFTDHSAKHSDRLLEYLHGVLWSNLGSSQALNSYELMILACSAYIHDLGMQWTYELTRGRYVEVSKPPYDSYDEIRSNHAKRSAMILKASLGIEKVPAPDLGCRSVKSIAELGAYIADCVDHHQGEYKVEALTDEFSGTVIRVGLLRGLLRIADTLDMDHRRVDMEKLTLYTIPIESKIHWWTHHYVKSIRIDKGKIKVAFDFPNTVAPQVARYFAGRVLDKLDDELKRHHEVFWSEMVFLSLERKDGFASSFETGIVKLPLPEDVQEEVNRRIRKEAESGKRPQDEANLVPPEHPNPDDWIAFWGFMGNPWVDMPTSISKNDFVATRSIERITSLIRSGSKGRSGQLQLLLADRGMGKTTFFDSLPSFFPFEDFDVAIVSLGDDISVFHTSHELTTFLFTRLYTHMKGKPVDKVNVPQLKEAMTEYRTKHPIVCFDNLDRFTSKQDMETIQKFFEESQAALQAIGRKATVLIAAAPEWEGMLSSSRLGYLNYDTAWKLKPLSLEETRELIDRRLSSAGSALSQIFADDAITLINTMAGGNPRWILRRCALLTETACTKNIKLIDRKFIMTNQSTELDTKLAKLMWDLASKSDRLKQALGAIYYFYESMERETLDADKGWSIFQQLTEGPVPVSRIDPAYVDALAFVSERDPPKGEAVARKLRSQVREYLRDWSSGGLSVSDFIAFFRLRPVHPKDFDLEILRQVKQAALPQDVRWYTEAARVSYNQASDENVFPTKVVELSWKAVEYLLKGLLIKEGFTKENAFASDKVGEDRYIDEAGRIRRKLPDQLSAEARGLMDMFSDYKNEKRLYVRTYDQMRLLLRKREQLLNAGVHYRGEAIQTASDNAKLCKLALRQAYGELVTLLF